MGVYFYFPTFYSMMLLLKYTDIKGAWMSCKNFKKHFLEFNFRFRDTVTWHLSISWKKISIILCQSIIWSTPFHRTPIIRWTPSHHMLDELKCIYSHSTPDFFGTYSPKIKSDIPKLQKIFARKNVGFLFFVQIFLNTKT